MLSAINAGSISSSVQGAEMKNSAIVVIILAFSWLAFDVDAAELYRYVDKDGTVTYSTTPPPADDKKASNPTIINATPQMSATNSSNCKSANCFDRSTQESQRRVAREKSELARIESQRAYDNHYRNAQSDARNAAQEAKEARANSLKKECESNRMVDCKK